MSSSLSENTDSGSAETSRVLLHRRDQWHNNNTWASFRQGLLKLKSLCGFSKAVFFILTWTLIVGAIYAAMLAGFIRTSAELRSSIFYQQQHFHIPIMHYTGCAGSHLPLCSILLVDS